MLLLKPRIERELCYFCRDSAQFFSRFGREKCTTLFIDYKTITKTTRSTGKLISSSGSALRYRATA